VVGSRTRASISAGACCVLSVPVTRPESLALYDAGRGQLFSGDYLYPGDLLRIRAGQRSAAYRDAAQRLLAHRAAT
jgi:hypothetical protein